MNWYLLLLAAMSIAAANGIFDEQLTELGLNNPRLLLTSVAAVSLPVVVFGAFALPFSISAMLIGLTSGACFSCAVLLYYRAVGCESVVQLALPGRIMAFIALPLNAFFLGQRLSGLQVIAFGLMLVSGWLLTQRQRSACRSRFTRGFWLMLGVEALFMFQDLFKNQLATNYNPWTMLTWERAGVIVVALVMLIDRSRRAEVEQTFRAMARYWRVRLGCRQVGHLLMSLFVGLAVHNGTATKVMIAAGAYCLLITTFKYFSLGRWPDRMQRRAMLIGTACALVGTLLVVF